MSEERTRSEAAQPGRIGRTLGGLILAPLLGGVVAATVTVIVAEVINPLSGALMSLHIFILMGLVAGAGLGIPAALIVGLPIHLLMKRAGMAGRLHYAALGGLISVLLFVAMTGAALLTWSSMNTVLAIAFALAGAISGSVFWSIRRPDHDIRPVLPADSPTDQEA